MIVVRNNVIPFRGFAAINLFGILFVRNGVVVTERLLNHERIHTRQMAEMLIVGFYLWYLFEWLIKLFRYGKKSYDNISFEREAYLHESDLNYLQKRKWFTWLNYL